MSDILHLGACIVQGRLHATVMRRNADGTITVVATAEMDEDSLRKHDCHAVMQPARPAEDVAPQRLLDLADRIDHEKLCRRAGLERDGWTQEQKDRCDAGVHLRRYADLIGSNSWRIYPPKGIPTRFSATTLDAAIAMAKREETRR